MEKEYYNETGKFLSGYDFDKLVTKMKSTTEFEWLSRCSRKALKDAIMTQEKAFKRFFKKKQGYPKFVSRKRQRSQSYFFIKDNIHFDTSCKNVISIPILGKVRITERDHLPDESSITSGRVIRDNLGKYYLSFMYNQKSYHKLKHNPFGIGIDVGIKNYATIAFQDMCYDPIIIPNFIKDDLYKKKEKRYNDLLRIISKKVEINYWKLMHQWMDKHPREEPNEDTKNIMKGESYSSNRIQKLRRKANLAYRKIVNYRIDCINKYIVIIVERTNPRYITLEDFSISDMVSNDKLSDTVTHRLHKYIQDSGFYMFKQKLIDKAKLFDIEVRLADQYFASSKACSCCGEIKDKLKLSDRVYKCKCCGMVIDRDTNAAINLVDLSLNKYHIA